MKQYINNKTVTATVFMLFLFVSVSAQHKNDAAITADTTELTKIVPGRFFVTDSITNTAAVSTVKGEVLNRTTTPNLYNTLSGRLPGLFVLQNGGMPGDDNPQLSLRGEGSYGLGFYNMAKVFVDGFQVPRDYLSYLSPSEIESISVLKDAASLATFGMLGANGVIWVKTKRGHIGKPTVNVQIKYGIQQPINILKPLNAHDFASQYNIAVSNDKGMWNPYYSKEQLNAYLNGNAPNIDWYNEVLKSKAPYTNVDLTFNGGTEKAKYNIVVGYMDQQGLFNVKNTDKTSNVRMQLFNLRSNLDFNLFKIFDASVDIGAQLQNNKRPNYWSVMDDLASYPSNIYPVYDTTVKDDKSNFSGTALYPNNPVGSIKGLGWFSSRIRTLQSNFNLKEDLDFITKGLYLNEAFSFYVRSTSNYSKTRDYARYFNGASTTTHQTTSITANGYGTAGMNQWMQGNFTMGYKNNFGKHQINSSLNFLLSNFLGQGLYEYNRRYMNLSGRINYSYNECYVAELGFSYFGSDAYAPGNRFGLYPTLSAAWILSNEEFLKNNPTISFFKVRASVGESGEMNTNITNQLAYGSNGMFLYQQYYSWSDPVYTGTKPPFKEESSMKPQYIANKNAFAEQSLKYNLGFDMQLFNKLQLTGDVFVDKRSKILTKDASHLNYYGDYNYFDNIGKMTNRGFEFSAVYKNNWQNFHYSFNAQIFYAKNTIDYMAEVAPAFPYNALTGRQYGTMMGLEATGFYQLEDFNSDGTLKQGIPTPLFGSVKPGDIRYKDLNKDGFVGQTDITKIGNPPYPMLGYSLGGHATYKNFDLGILFQGTAGSSVNLLNYPAQFIAFVNNGNAYKTALNSWAYYPDQGIDTRSTATYPRLTTQKNDNNYRGSSFWIKKNNYLRLKNIELGYDFKGSFLNSSPISNLRIYLDAVNLVTFSNLLKEYRMDPESKFGYPSLKSYNVGVSLTF